MRACLLPLVLLLGCPSASAPVADPTPAPPLDLPEPWVLPEQDAPDPFTSYRDGSPVTDWDARRGELLTLFAHYVYGADGPDAAIADPAFVTTPRDEGAVVQGTLSVAGVSSALTVFLPPGPGPHPVFLALNKCGNHTLVDWPEVPITSDWAPDSCLGGLTEDSRGSRADSWPVADLLAAGWGLAALHEDPLVPDDRDLAFSTGLVAEVDVADGDPRRQWGAVGAWAWGLQRAVDALLLLPAVDPDRIVTVGHSRRGKAALLAAARDPRIAATIPHQSGTAGVTLSRSNGGESVASITTVFPHWFAPRFTDFANEERRLPVDQHLLVALVAPRPLFASDGDADDWADPLGARESIQRAAPVWESLGADGLVTEGGEITTDGALAWGTRPGGHSLEASDWQRFLSWVQAQGL